MQIKTTINHCTPTRTVKIKTDNTKHWWEYGVSGNFTVAGRNIKWYGYFENTWAVCYKIKYILIITAILSISICARERK